MNREHTTVSQNQAHRSDIAWHKMPVSDQAAVKRGTGPAFYDASREWFISEYHNVFTGQIIRKSGRMTGNDWFVFNEAGEVIGREHSLTFAKFAAQNA